MRTYQQYVDECKKFNIPPLPEDQWSNLDAYNDYVKNGDPFFMVGLSLEQFTNIKRRIISDMNRHGSD